MALQLNKDTVYRAAKARDKEYFINDGGGLYLVVGKNGTKIWKFIFSFEGKRKKLSFGVWIPHWKTPGAKLMMLETALPKASILAKSESKSVQKLAKPPKIKVE